MAWFFEFRMIHLEIRFPWRVSKKSPLLSHTAAIVVNSLRLLLRSHERWIWLKTGSGRVGQGCGHHHPWSEILAPDFGLVAGEFLSYYLSYWFSSYLPSQLELADQNWAPGCDHRGSDQSGDLYPRIAAKAPCWAAHAASQFAVLLTDRMPWQDQHFIWVSYLHGYQKGHQHHPLPTLIPNRHRLGVRA